jgi:hypothetical protein
VTKYALATDELKGFQNSVYKLVRERTCVNCHAKIQTPFFASDDPQVAYDAIMSAKKVNFQKPEFSRIYQRLATDHHNCWYDGDCDASAKEMLDAIYKWRESVKDYGVSLGIVTESQPFLKNGMAPLPAGAYLFDAENAKVILPAHSKSGNKLDVGLDSAANNGKYLYVPEHGRTTLNADLQDFTQLSYAEFHFKASSATYRYFARMAGNNKTNDGFFKIKLNNGSAVKFGATARTDGSWVWQEISVPGAITPDADNVLTVGEYDDGPKLDMLLVVPSSEVVNYPNNLVAREDFLNRMSGRKSTLTFDLSSILKDKGIYLTVDASIFDESGYFFENAHIDGYTKNIRVQGVRLIQNGLFNPQDSDWYKIK